MSSISKSILASILSIVVSLSTSFLITPFLVNSLGKELYSFFPIANNFTSYVSLFTMAINSMVARFLVVSIKRNNIEKANKYYSSVLVSNIIMCLVLIVPMSLCIIFLPEILNVPFGYESDIRILFALIFISFLINLLFSIFGVSTFIKERMDLYSYQNIGQSIVRIISYVFLFCFFKPRAYFLGIATLIISIYNSIVQFVFSKKLLPNFKINFRNFDKSCIFELISSGMWNSINNLGSILLQSIILLLANIYIGASAAGDLSIIQVLPNLMTTIICGVYGVLLPNITNIYANNNKEKTKENVLMSQKILGIISSIPVIIIMIVGKAFFALWVPNEDAQYLNILSTISILPLLVHSSMWTVYGLNIANNKLKQPALVFLFVGIINIFVSNVVLKYTNFGTIALVTISSILNITYYLIYMPMYTSHEMDLPKFTFYPTILKTIILAIFMVIIGKMLISRLVLLSWYVFFVVVFILEIIGISLYFALIYTNIERKYIISKVLRRRDCDD